MDISLETWEKLQKKRDTIRELNKEFNQYGLAYLSVEPNCLGNKPCLCKNEPEYPTIKQLGIREARKLLKELKRKGEKK